MAFGLKGKPVVTQTGNSGFTQNPGLNEEPGKPGLEGSIANRTSPTPSSRTQVENKNGMACKDNERQRYTHTEIQDKGRSTQRTIGQTTGNAYREHFGSGSIPHTAKSAPEVVEGKWKRKIALPSISGSVLVAETTVGSIVKQVSTVLPMETSYDSSMSRLDQTLSYSQAEYFGSPGPLFFNEEIRFRQKCAYCDTEIASTSAHWGPKMFQSHIERCEARKVLTNGQISLGAWC